MRSVPRQGRTAGCTLRAARAGRCKGAGPPGLHFPAGGALASLPAAPRYACGSVRASVYFRPPRAWGRACRTAGAAGPAQPWTGSWGESGGRAGGPGPREGTRGAPRAAPVKGIRCGRSGLGRQGRLRGDWTGERGAGPVTDRGARRGRTRGVGTGSGVARPGRDRRPRWPPHPASRPRAGRPLLAAGCRAPGEVGPGAALAGRRGELASGRNNVSTDREQLLKTEEHEAQQPSLARQPGSGGGEPGEAGRGGCGGRGARRAAIGGYGPRVG